MRNKVLYIGALTGLLAVLIVAPLSAQTLPPVPGNGIPRANRRMERARFNPAPDAIWRWAEQLVELEDVLGLSLAEMVDMHEDGMTLQDMAQEQGVDVNEVLLYVCPAAQRFERLAQDGRISEATAREMSRLVCQRRMDNGLNNE